MTILYLFLLYVVITPFFVYGQDNTIAECIPVNYLLNKDKLNVCCAEKGIRCQNGHIVEINLEYRNLYGQIPPDIGNLSELQYLSLKDNRLIGSIPKEIGYLIHLQTLNLSFNSLKGSIPQEIGNLTELQTLNLGFNNLKGSIPLELGKLTQLQILDLNTNELSGSIPSELGELTQLQTLDLSNNNFCGSLPKLSAKDDINIYQIHNLGKECPDDETQQKDGTTNEPSKDNETKENSSEGSQRLPLIIVGVLALILILLISVFFINKNKNKNDNKINANDESLLKINIPSSDMDHAHGSEKDLRDYTFIEEKYFEWKIENWNQLKEKEYSSIFNAYEHLWKLMLITDSFNENKEESVDVGLRLCDKIDNKEYIYANFIVYFRNYNNNQIYKEIEYDDEPTVFSSKSFDHGIMDAILKSELYDKGKEGSSLLENNKIIIGVLIKFYSTV